MENLHRLTNMRGVAFYWDGTRFFREDPNWHDEDDENPSDVPYHVLSSLEIIELANDLLNLAKIVK